MAQGSRCHPEGLLGGGAGDAARDVSRAHRQRTSSCDRSGLRGVGKGIRIGSLATRSVRGQGVALAVVAGSALAVAPAALRRATAARVLPACGASIASALGSPRQ